MKKNPLMKNNFHIRSPGPGAGWPGCRPGRSGSPELEFGQEEGPPRGADQVLGAVGHPPGGVARVIWEPGAGKVNISRGRDRLLKSGRIKRTRISRGFFIVKIIVTG